MRQLLRELAQGINKNNIPHKHSALIADLSKRKLIKLKSNIFRLDSTCRVGIVDIARDGTGFLEIFGDEGHKDLLIEANNLNGATKGDMVIAERLFKKRGRPSAKVAYILERKNPFSLCYLMHLKHAQAYDLKTDAEISIQASQKSLKKLPDGTVFKVDNQSGQIVEVLGVLDDPAVDEKISLALYNKVELFSKQAEKEAKAYGDSVDKSHYPNRTDLTHLPFCTIDPPDAKDHDDAIYFDVDSFTLYVAIADVSEYVSPLTQLDKEAESRGFSIYLPHKSIPMLPRTLSENICSLKENVDRLAFIYKARLHKRTYEPLQEEFFEGIIQSRRKYSYERIDEFLEGRFENTDSTDDEILKYLMPLAKITTKLKQKRLEQGYDFANDEIRMELDRNFNLRKTRIEEETPSHGLIEDCMLLANKGAAQRMDKGIFRVHESPSLERIEQLTNDMISMGIHVKPTSDFHELVTRLQKEAERKDLRKHVDKMIIRAQKQACYTHQNVGHFGLGFEDYAHFTSPIRRYSDLILHRLLKATLNKDDKKRRFILQGIEGQAEKISELEREAARVEWDYKDRKFVRWANEHLGEHFDAIIIDTDKMPIAIIEDRIMGARVFLQETELDSFEKIKLEITEVNIPQAKIFGRTIEKINP